MRVVVVQEGLANVCLVGSSTTVQKAKVESSIPRKRGAAAAGYDKALQSFFNKVTSAPQPQWVQICGICTALIYPPCKTPLGLQSIHQCCISRWYDNSVHM